MHTSDHHLRHTHKVAARFHDEGEVEEVVRDLQALGEEEHLEIEVHHAQAHELDEAERRMAMTIGEGILAGAVAGALLGMAIMSILGVTVTPDLDLPTLVAAGAAGGIVVGMLFGAIFGMALRGEGIHEATWWDSFHLEPGEGIVVAAVEDPPERRRTQQPGIDMDWGTRIDQEVMSVFTRHHGRVVGVP